MVQRLDIHRPSVIIPADYEFVACDYYGPGAESMGFIGERMAWRHHREASGGSYSQHEHGGTCYVCGASAMYVAIFYHALSNSYIATGMDCAEKMDIGDPILFRTFRQRVQAGREVWAGKQKAQKVLSGHGLDAAWALYNADHGKAVGAQWSAQERQEAIICEIVGRLIKYGSISAAQVALIGRLLDQIDHRAEVAVKRAAEVAAAAPVPVGDGRVKIEGIVLAVREPDAYAPFPQWKMLVKHDSGWKVWGSIPASLGSAADLKGHKVHFMARIEASKDDPKFGFYSRPTMAEVED